MRAAPGARAPRLALLLLGGVAIAAGAQAHAPARTDAARAGAAAGVDARAHADPPARVDAGSRAEVLARADRLQHAHRFAEAERLLTDWLARTPDDVEARLQRAQLRILAGRPRGALADCSVAAPRLDALAASACVAQARGALGDLHGARALVEGALRDGVGEPAVDSWASGIAAELAEREADVAAADRWHRRSVANAGEAHFPRLAYADFLLAQGRAGEVPALLADAPPSASVRARLRRAQLVYPRVTPSRGSADDRPRR